jgi:hypothetical protein
MMITRRQLLAGAAATAATAATAACSGGDDTAETTAPTTAAPTTTRQTTTTVARTTTTVEATTTTVPPDPVMPLLGTEIVDEGIANRCAIVVKVSNDPGARPQSGLNQADIVFEAWGAGPTRFAAIFHSQDAGYVGPIRSGRTQDVNLVGSFNRALFACSGGNRRVIDSLRSSDLFLITEGFGPGWLLDPNRKRPHKTFVDVAGLRTNAGLDRVAPVTQFQYRAVGEAATQGDVLAGIDLAIQQVDVSWRFDAAQGLYVRAQDGRDHVLGDDQQVTTENVVVMWTTYDPSVADSRSPDGNSIGTNQLVVLTGGRVVSGTWARDDRLQPFRFADASGAPILLTPGRTFISMPNDGLGGFGGQDTLNLIA